MGWVYCKEKGECTNFSIYTFPLFWNTLDYSSMINAEYAAIERKICPGRSGASTYICAPGGIRTPNPQIRSLMLYPVELRMRFLHPERNPFGIELRMQIKFYLSYASDPAFAPAIIPAGRSLCGILNPT